MGIKLSLHFPVIHEFILIPTSMERGLKWYRFSYWIFQ